MKRKMLNSQKYSECQLVAIINAATYLGEKPVDPDSEEYERLVDLVGARHGSAIHVRSAVSYLRLVMHEIDPVSINDVRLKVVGGYPVSVTIWHHGVGFHSTLLTDGDHRGAKAWNLGVKGYPKNRVGWNRMKELVAAVPAHCRKAIWFELDPLRKRSLEKK